MHDQGSYIRRLRRTEGHTRTGHAPEMKGHTYGYTRRDIHREGCTSTHGGEIHREKHMLRFVDSLHPWLFGHTRQSLLHVDVGENPWVGWANSMARGGPEEGTTERDENNRQVDKSKWRCSWAIFCVRVKKIKSRESFFFFFVLIPHLVGWLVGY